jgi:hypothetical protein
VINTNTYAKTKYKNERVNMGVMWEVFSMQRGPVKKASKIIIEMVSHQERVEGKMRESRA